jgi:hypothetical protein
MRVEHGGANVSMAKQFLYRADVVPRLQQVGGKAMAKRMATRRLQYAGAAHRHLYRALDYFFALRALYDIAAIRLQGNQEHVRHSIA